MYLRDYEVGGGRPFSINIKISLLVVTGLDRQPEALKLSRVLTLRGGLKGGNNISDHDERSVRLDERGEPSSYI